MAKATMAYSGTDSYGRPLMLAQREDGTEQNK